jgi:hypothetical protein
MSQPRIRSADQRQIVAPGETRKMPRLSRPHRGGMEYERVEALSDFIKEMAAVGFRMSASLASSSTRTPASRSPSRLCKSIMAVNSRSALTKPIWR